MEAFAIVITSILNRFKILVKMSTYHNVVICDVTYHGNEVFELKGSTSRLRKSFINSSLK